MKENKQKNVTDILSATRSTVARRPMGTISMKTPKKPSRNDLKKQTRKAIGEMDR